MNLGEIEKLITILRSNGVTRFKSADIELRFSDVKSSGKAVQIMPDIPLQAAPPVEDKIPHHVNEVVGLLKLDDEALVDKLFPDYSNIQKAQGE